MLARQVVTKKREFEDGYVADFQPTYKEEDYTLWDKLFDGRRDITIPDVLVAYEAIPQLLARLRGTDDLKIIGCKRIPQHTAQTFKLCTIALTWLPVMKQKRVSGYFRRPALVDEYQNEKLEARVAALEKFVCGIEKKLLRRKRPAITPNKGMFLNCRSLKKMKKKTVEAPAEDSMSDEDNKETGADLVDNSASDGGDHESERKEMEGWPKSDVDAHGNQDEHEGVDEREEEGLGEHEVDDIPAENADSEECEDSSGEEPPPVLAALKEGDGVSLQWVEKGATGCCGTVLYRATTSNTFYVSEDDGSVEGGVSGNNDDENIVEEGDETETKVSGVAIREESGGALGGDNAEGSTGSEKVKQKGGRGGNDDEGVEVSKESIEGVDEAEAVATNTVAEDESNGGTKTEATVAVAKDAEDEKSEKGQRPDKVIFSCLGLFDVCAIDMGGDYQAYGESRRSVEVDGAGDMDDDDEGDGFGCSSPTLRNEKVTYLSDSLPCPRSEKHRPAESEADLAALLLAKEPFSIGQIVPEAEDNDFVFFQKVFLSNPEVLHLGAQKYDLDNQFFMDLATPQKWVTTKHMEVLVDYVSERHTTLLKENRSMFVEPWFIEHLAGKAKKFNSAIYKGRVFSDPKLVGYLTKEGKKLGVDVDTVYSPMFWGTNHWIGLRISITQWSVLIYDPDRSLRSMDDVMKIMTPIAKMLPYLVRKVCRAEYLSGNVLQPFDVQLMADRYQNSRSGDYGPVEVKFMELAATGVKEPDVDDLTDRLVDNFRK
ncbi:hypothetical protein Bca4012_084687 [Brassica carinata]